MKYRPDLSERERREESHHYDALRFVDITLFGEEPDEYEDGDAELGDAAVMVDAHLTEEQIDLLRRRLAGACGECIRKFLEEQGVSAKEVTVCT
jgi:hypothetical protein